MNAIKHLLIVSCCVLTACAPPRPSGEAPTSINPKTNLNATNQQESVENQESTPKNIESPAATPAENKKMPVEKRTATTKTVSSWQIRGSMAAKAKGKGWSATMNWAQQGPGSYQIRLMGPLGGGSVIITRSGGTVTFKDGKKTSSSSNADELLYKQTGIRLPVSSLYYWVRGLPAPGGIQGEKRDGSNHLVLLRQSGYTINFMQYTSVKGIDLPSSIRLEGNGVMVKVNIRSWSI